MKKIDYYYDLVGGEGERVIDKFMLYDFRTAFGKENISKYILDGLMTELLSIQTTNQQYYVLAVDELRKLYLSEEIKQEEMNKIKNLIINTKTLKTLHLIREHLTLLRSKYILDDVKKKYIDEILNTIKSKNVPTLKTILSKINYNNEFDKNDINFLLVVYIPDDYIQQITTYINTKLTTPIYAKVNKNKVQPTPTPRNKLKELLQTYSNQLNTQTSV